MEDRVLPATYFTYYEHVIKKVNDEKINNDRKDPTSFRPFYKAILDWADLLNVSRRLKISPFSSLCRSCNPRPYPKT